MKLFHAVKNLTFSGALIAKFLVLASANKIFQKDEIKKRQRAVELTTEHCRALLRNLKFEVKYTYSDPHLFTGGKNYFMVCNHMSYMDIIFLSAGEPAAFVTSVEMKNTPFLGDLSDLGGSYFVERRDRTKVAGEVKDLAKILQQGFNVFVFPEGTSTNGMKILPFKRALFNSAIEAGVDVLPISLRYEFIDGEPFSEKNKDRLCWYGSMPFTKHFMQIISLSSLKVTVNYLTPISVKEFPDRHPLSDRAYQQISSKYFEGRAFKDDERLTLSH
ncbi:MAG: 1-acyl-sn-glycerol-3-phosphate acyltransferase [Bdellovibrionales bacterium]|nr:1-acyl-sn-glycerol-3-phosphate acyltransferase [Bdellovibrionales bacterium]